MNQDTTQQAPKPKPLIRRRNGVGTGTTSLLMIFTVLCFATLAMLSLSTAAASRRIQQRGIENSVNLAAAQGQAAQAVAALDEALLALRQEYTDPPGAITDRDVSYDDAALNAATALGWAALEEAGALELVLPVDEGTELVTTLRLNAQDEEARYTLTGQASRLIDGWQPEDDGGLWLP